MTPEQDPEGALLALLDIPNLVLEGVGLSASTISSSRATP